MRSSPSGVRTLALDPLTPGAVPATRFELPAFETSLPDSPTVRSFALAGGATIPPEVLASATAAARATGYAEGWAKGIDEARTTTAIRFAAEEQALAERAADAQRAIDAVHHAATELQHRRLATAVDVQEQIVAAAWEIATALVGDVLADDERRGRSALTRALALSPSDEDVLVSVSPEDFAVLLATEDSTPPDTDPAMTPPTRDAIRQQRGLRTVTIVPDAALAPGDATATSGATTIDARLTSAVERVKAVLAP